MQKNLDLARYQGLWYDAASIPQFFNRNVAWQTAEYTLMTDDTDGIDTPYVRVHNIAYNTDGSIKNQITGRAVVVDAKDPAALNVSFGGIFSLFSNPERANYIVHDTDYDTYSIVGSDDGSNLYFLVRERPIQEDLYAQMVEYARNLGYEVERLREGYHAILPFPIEEPETAGDDCQIL
ncbi:MAG: lipocalin family protein [Candidatus Roizmanbacteria bacterium]